MGHRFPHQFHYPCPANQVQEHFESLEEAQAFMESMSSSSSQE